MTAHYHVTADGRSDNGTKYDRATVTPAAAQLTKAQARAELAAWVARWRAAGWSAVQYPMQDSALTMAPDGRAHVVAYVEWCARAHR